MSLSSLASSFSSSDRRGGFGDFRGFSGSGGVGRFTSRCGPCTLSLVGSFFGGVWVEAVCKVCSLQATSAIR